MRLIQLAVSMSSFKVRLALRLKGLDVPLEDPPGGTYRSDAFKAINPAGTVPTLVDGDFWLSESDAIIEYLDDIGAGRTLRPADPRETARARMVSRWVDFRLDPVVRRLFAHTAPHVRDTAALKAIDENLDAILRLVEKGLDLDGPYACGSDASIADCGLCACLIWLDVLRLPLALDAIPGPRLAAVASTLDNDRRIAQDIAEYRGLAESWLSQRLKP